MWPFSKKHSDSELHEAFRQLKADFAALEFEWVQTRHALKKLAGRLAKSEALEETKRVTANPAPEEPQVSPENGALRFLDDRQRALQQDILKKRARA